MIELKEFRSIYIPLWLNIKKSKTLDKVLKKYVFTFHSD